MSNRWREKSIEDLLDGRNQQPNSQQAYEIDREIQRRSFSAQAELSELQKAAARAQIEASDAVVRNAKWIRLSAISVMIGTIVALVGLLISLFHVPAAVDPKVSLEEAHQNAGLEDIVATEVKSAPVS